VLKSEHRREGGFELVLEVLEVQDFVLLGLLLLQTEVVFDRVLHFVKEIAEPCIPRDLKLVDEPLSGLAQLLWRDVLLSTKPFIELLRIASLLVFLHNLLNSESLLITWLAIAFAVGALGQAIKQFVFLHFKSTPGSHQTVLICLVLVGRRLGLIRHLQAHLRAVLGLHVEKVKL